MEPKTTSSEIDGSIAILTLSRPQRRNAWTREKMHTEVRHLLDQADRNLYYSTVIITGAGDDFCVGADSQALEGHLEKRRL